MNNYGYYIEGQVGVEKFPRKFSNQIFFSDHVTDLILEYETVYSVKYQISGSENYEIDNKQFTLTSNKYLVVNDNQKVICDSASSEKAISIFIDPATLKDVFTNCISTHEELLEEPGSACRRELVLYENIFPLEQNLISAKLKKLSNIFLNNKVDTKSFRIDFFYDISRELILSQQEILKQIDGIDCSKSSTKKELYNRMISAKEYIIENWNTILNNETIAAQVYMSPYHFHRVFSSTFKTAPIKFHSAVKMKKVRELLLSGNYSISDAARISGYSDIFSFSKAFKKHFGYSPSKLLICSKPN